MLIEETRNKVLLIGLLFIPYSFLAYTPRILIKIPTRQRQQQFFKNFDLFYTRLSGEGSVHFLIACDIDDTHMNNTEVHKRLSLYKNVMLLYDNHQSKVDAYNSGIQERLDMFDILILASDDMEPIVQGYDRIIAEAMVTYFPNFDGVLHVNDGNMGPQCNIMPIIGVTFYKRFGYAYSPAYKSLWCDEELTEIARILRKEAYLDRILIKHNHPGWGRGEWDELYVRNESFYHSDGDTFKVRRKKGFDVKEILVQECCPKLWSILILYQAHTKAACEQLVSVLRKQIETLGLVDDIEILTSSDPWAVSNYYEGSLLRASRGNYISYLGADYQISDRFVEAMYRAMQANPDCIALRGLKKIGNSYTTFEQSIRHKEPHYEQNIQCVYVNLINPIKRSIAVKCYFPYKGSPQRFTWEWALAKADLLEYEVTVTEPLVVVSS